MAQSNSPEYDAEWLIRRIIRPGDAFPYTRREQIKFLVFGSPTLRYILTQVRDYLLPSRNSRPQKIIVTEDTPAVAFFYEQVLNHLHVDTKIVTVKLSRKIESWIAKEAKKAQLYSLLGLLHHVAIRARAISHNGNKARRNARREGSGDVPAGWDPWRHGDYGVMAN